MEVLYCYWLGHLYILCDKITTEIGLEHISFQIVIKYNFLVEGV